MPSPSRRRLPPVFNAWLAHAALCSWGHRKIPHPLGFRLAHPTLTVPTFHALRNGPSTLQRMDKSARFPSDASDLWGAIVAQPGAMSIPCGMRRDSECECAVSCQSCRCRTVSVGAERGVRLDTWFYDQDANDGMMIESWPECRRGSLPATWARHRERAARRHRSCAGCCSYCCCRPGGCRKM
jgi:hypothetical protein